MFGHLFPPFFKNWWSDDWISTVYGVEHTFRSEDVQIQHNVNAQKTNGLTRYAVDQVRGGYYLCFFYEFGAFLCFATRADADGNNLLQIS